MGDTGDLKNLFGGRLAESRRLGGFTQEELAGRLGVTPQALSKWERGTSFPDLAMLAEICELLGASADYLLGTIGGKITENGDQEAQNEIFMRLRRSLEPLELLLGMEVLPLFQDMSFVQDVAAKRRELALEGILMPVIRIKDQLSLAPKEFMILAYDNVLYHETLDEVNGEKLGYIIGKLGEVIRGRYDEIVNADIIKQLVDNLRVEYPALITGIVPEKISYGLLLDVVRELIKRGDMPCYLPRIIEYMEHEMRENGVCGAAELAERVGGRLERADNYHIFMHQRRQA